jgi:hypothetical protein
VILLYLQELFESLSRLNLDQGAMILAVSMPRLGQLGTAAAEAEGTRGL